MSLEEDKKPDPLRELVRNGFDKVNSNLNEVGKKVDKLNTIVLGDKEAEIPGLAQRMNKVEKNEAVIERLDKLESDKKSQNKIIAFVAAIGTGIGAGLIYLFEHLPKFLKAIPIILLFFGDLLLYLILIVVVGLFH